MTGLMYCLVRGGGGCEIRTREGLPPTRFPTMLTSVHRRPPQSANCANTIRVSTGERPRTGMNETKLSPGPGRSLGSGVAAESLDGSSAACVAVTGRRQRFVLHGSQNCADSARLARVPSALVATRRLPGLNAWPCRLLCRDPLVATRSRWSKPGMCLPDLQVVNSRRAGCAEGRREGGSARDGP